jgi:hypothetical protein
MIHGTLGYWKRLYWRIVTYTKCGGLGMTASLTSTYRSIDDGKYN